MVHATLTSRQKDRIMTIDQSIIEAAKEAGFTYEEGFGFGIPMGVGLSIGLLLTRFAAILKEREKAQQEPVGYVDSTSKSYPFVEWFQAVPNDGAKIYLAPPTDPNLSAQLEAVTREREELAEALKSAADYIDTSFNRGAEAYARSLKIIAKVEASK